MFTIEQKALRLLRKYAVWVLIGGGLIFSVLMRQTFLDVASSDMNMFLLPWYQELVDNGADLSAVAKSSSNYNIPYLLLMLLATKLPLDPISAIKFFSFIGDYLCATAAGMIIYRRYDNNLKYALLAFTGAALLPLTVFNSAYWGQCDSIYTAFLLFALYCTLRERWTLSFVWFSVALCFKLQAIFLLPFFIILYFSRRAFSALHFFLLPCILFLSSLPAVLYGAPFTAAFDIYTRQVNEYPFVFINYYNVSTLLRWGNMEHIGRYLILVTLLICFAMLGFVIIKAYELKGDTLLLAAAWSAMTCAAFLPSMHERYGYAAEIILLVWLACAPSCWRRWVAAAGFYLVGAMGVTRFLFGTPWPEDSPFLGLFCLAVYIFTCVLLIKPMLPGEDSSRLLKGEPQVMHMPAVSGETPPPEA